MRNHMHLADALRSMVVSIFYWLIGASIAELASSMPTAAGGLWSPAPEIYMMTCADAHFYLQCITGHRSLQVNTVVFAASSQDGGTSSAGS